MVNETTIAELMKAQNQLNSLFDTVHGSFWYQQNYPFADYVWVECGELANHHGKVFHYKKVKEDRDQVIVELLDLLHFGLSISIIKQDKPGLIAATCNRGAESADPEEFFFYVRLVAKHAITAKGFDWYYFAKSCAAYGVSMNEIFRAYWLKYTLNEFRIDNGLLEGDYTKMWHGEEDNVYLTRFAEEAPHDAPAEVLVKYIRGRLQETYETVTSGK